MDLVLIQQPEKNWTRYAVYKARANFHLKLYILLSIWFQCMLFKKGGITLKYIVIIIIIVVFVIFFFASLSKTISSIFRM